MKWSETERWCKHSQSMHVTTTSCHWCYIAWETDIITNRTTTTHHLLLYPINWSSKFLQITTELPNYTASISRWLESRHLWFTHITSGYNITKWHRTDHRAMDVPESPFLAVKHFALQLVPFLIHLALCLCLHKDEFPLAWEHLLEPSEILCFIVCQF